MTHAGLLIFDGDCGFCTTCANWYAQRAKSASSIAPWQAVDLDAHGLTEADVTASVQWSHNGHTSSGADACANAMKAVPGPWRFAGHLLALPGVIHLARLAYPIVARYRYRLPGATNACKI